jgi:hypothetical protein
MINRTAERFRFYAALCREFAQSSPYEEYIGPLLAQAERWEQGAAWVERDVAAIAASRELLARVDAK